MTTLQWVLYDFLYFNYVNATFLFFPKVTGSHWSSTRLNFSKLKTNLAKKTTQTNEVKILSNFFLCFYLPRITDQHTR